MWPARSTASSPPQPLLDKYESVKGTQYTSLAFGKRCREMRVVTSTGSAGDCFDNAMAESFFATLECELIDRRAFRTQAEARMVIFEFIEGWYNRKRRHSALGYLSPNDFERAAVKGTPGRAGTTDHHDRTTVIRRCPDRRPGGPQRPSRATLPIGLGKEFTTTGDRSPQCW